MQNRSYYITLNLKGLNRRKSTKKQGGNFMDNDRNFDIKMEGKEPTPKIQCASCIHQKVCERYQKEYMEFSSKINSIPVPEHMKLDAECHFYANIKNFSFVKR